MKNQEASRRLRRALLALTMAASGLLAADDSAVSSLANADPNYVALRNVDLENSIHVSDLTLKRDIGVFRLIDGHITLAKPVLGRVSLAIFNGQGEFIFEPSIPWEARSLEIYIGERSLRETFRGLVLWFTDETAEELQSSGEPAPLDPEARQRLERFRNRVRTRREQPRDRTEAVLTGEDMDNVEADILADLYNPALGGAFRAYIAGAKYDDLRFFVRPRGGLPQIISDEEVALVNFAPGGDRAGVWYMAHSTGEHDDAGMPVAAHEFPIDAKHYQIETTILKNNKLEARCEVLFTARADGERVIKFGLLPSLRVQSVSVPGQGEIAFMQEELKQDPAFYAVLPEPTSKGQEYRLEIVYAGEDVISKQGGGNFAVGARTSWYPSLGSFKDRATFDITYRYPKQYKLVSVGAPGGEEKDGDFVAARWKSVVPLAVAGFNFGRFTKKETFDEPTQYQVEGYAANEVPDFLRMMPDGAPVGRMSPKRMIDQTIAETQLSLRVFTNLFGPLPYGRIAMTQQPQFSFGQSWPMLVYLPVSAYLDSTQRWVLLGGGSARFADFVQEVTPHEVAHQWWGHLVGWSSYRDQWISEGFADFSAGMFLHLTRKKPDEYLRFVERWRQAILEKNQFGYSANDVGPLWMGQRLITPKTGDSYSKLIYPKGGYVLHMLRWMMYHNQTGDQGFIDMMHDFVKSHQNTNASTQSFQEVVERHMSPAMDLEGNGKMDWFFRQWVYGSEIPSYDLRYKFEPADGDRWLLTMLISQRGVSDDFRMLVPIYGETDGRRFRLGSIQLVGNSTSDEIQVPLPQKFDKVLLNSFHDILADDVTSRQM